MKEKEKKRKKSSSRRSSQGWRAAQRVPGLGEGGNDAARPAAVSGAAFAGNPPAEAARIAEAPGRTAEPAAQADSMGLRAWGTSCTLGPLYVSTRENPPTHTHTFPHTEAPMPRGERINPWVGCRSRLSWEGVRLEQGNPQRPRRGGGHEPEVQAQLPAKAKVRGRRQSQLSLHPPPPKAPFPSSNLSGLTHRVS